MDPSHYNTILGIDGNSILFNAFTGRFIVVKGKDLSGADTDLCHLAVQNPVLGKQLIENGFILENPETQLTELKRRISDACSDSSSFILNINPTIDCNFNCWYCYENHIKESKMSLETIESVKKLINKKSSQIKHIQLGFFWRRTTASIQRCVPSTD